MSLFTEVFLYKIIFFEINDKIIIIIFFFFQFIQIFIIVILVIHENYFLIGYYYKCFTGFWGWSDKLHSSRRRLYNESYPKKNEYSWKEYYKLLDYVIISTVQ